MNESTLFFIYLWVLRLLYNNWVNGYPLLGQDNFTCLHQSAPDGYFRNGDCRRMNLFVCEVNKNIAFRQPPQGRVVCNICKIFKMKAEHLEHYIMSPNYPDPYPNNYEEVNQFIS